MATATATATATANNRVINNMAEFGLTDLHTHILPGIDDGAKDLNAALQMLQAQKASGVERVALTPHFYPLEETLDEFLSKRQQAWELLLSGWDGGTMPELRLGAEVHFSSCLADMDLQELTLYKTDYMLLELPDIMQPTFLEPVLQQMLDRGITPILAHVERCAYFAEKPAKLQHLVEMGVLAQISLRMFSNKRMRKFAEICLQKNAAQIIASDIHGLGNASFGVLTEGMHEELVERAERIAKAVWDNIQLQPIAPIPIQKKLFGYA